MQKIGFTIYQFFLIPDLVSKRVSPIDVITMGQSTTIFTGIGPFRHGNNQPTKKPGNSSASLLLSGEKAVFCNMNINDFTQTFLALFISIFIWICLPAKDQTCQLWIVQLNFSPLFNLKQSRSLLCLLQFRSLRKLTYNDMTCVRGCEVQSYNHLPSYTFKSWSWVSEVGR